VFSDYSWVNTGVTVNKIWKDKDNYNLKTNLPGRTFHWVKYSYKLWTMFCNSKC